MTRKRALTKLMFAKLAPAMNARDWAKALAAVEDAVAVMPDELDFRVLHVGLLLHKLRDLQTGLPTMRQLVRDAIDKKSELWMAGALRQLFDPANDNSHFPSAERLAIGKELSEHILALDPQQRGGGFKFLSYEPVAQYYYESGNKDRAIELVEVALKSLERPKPIPAEPKRTLSRWSKRWPTTRARRQATALFVQLRKTDFRKRQSDSRNWSLGDRLFPRRAKSPAAARRRTLCALLCSRQSLTQPGRRTPVRCEPALPHQGRRTVGQECRPLDTMKASGKADMHTAKMREMGSSSSAQH
ncbi:hypothetical protein [Bradyrhizobium sp. BRP22]|uniref:hypothetical protein n=1 Tax=Bradyrhizobium sp. BRP22 TaxID=2793821 RepID=UPI0031FBFB27